MARHVSSKLDEATQKPQRDRRSSLRQRHDNPRHPRQDAARRLWRPGWKGGADHRHRRRQQPAGEADRTAGGVRVGRRSFFLFGVAVGFESRHRRRLRAQLTASRHHIKYQIAKMATAHMRAPMSTATTAARIGAGSSPGGGAGGASASSFPGLMMSGWSRSKAIRWGIS
jgi:hypothetical protein